MSEQMQVSRAAPISQTTNQDLGAQLKKIIWPPPVINGEDPNSYNQLHDQVRSAVGPTDVIEEMWVRDVVDTYWESARLRRLRAKLFVACEHEGLRLILGSLVDEGEIDKLVYGWLDRNPRSVKKVNRILAQAGFTNEMIVARTLSARLDEFDRIDRMIAQADAWRNVVLREIDRHREAVARRPREALNDVQDADFEDQSARERGGGRVRASARVRANRSNAKRSTGPRTEAGKARVAFNALQHGLSVAAKAQPQLGRTVEGLTRLLAGENPDATHLEAAQRLAEALIDLRRVSEVRLGLLRKLLDTPEYVTAKPDKTRFYVIRKIWKRGPGVDRTGPSGSALMRESQAERFAGIIVDLSEALARLDRYRRRALSRRKFAVRALDELSAAPR